MPRDRQWVDDLRAQRPRLLHRQAALAAAQAAASKERESLSTRRFQLAKETALLKERLKEIERQNEDLNASRLDANSRYDAAATSLKEVESFLEVIDHAGLPLQELPSDLLRLIMEQAASEDPHFRWVAMEVCRKWREIAQSTPCLWSHVEIDFNCTSIVELNRARVAFNSGGNCSLDLRLSFDPVCEEERSSNASAHDQEQAQPVRNQPVHHLDWFTHSWRPGRGKWATEYATGWGPAPAVYGMEGNHELTWDLIGILVPHLSRVTKLYWQISDATSSSWTWDACWIARQMMTVELPRLTVLRIDLNGLIPKRDGHHERAIRTICGASVNLARLSLRHSYWFPLASTSLECLELTDSRPSMKELLECLSSQKNLRVLRLWQALPPTMTFEASDVPPIVQLPSLKEFFHCSQYDENAEVDGFLLSRLACPQLHRAIIKSHTWEHIVGDMVSFFLRAPHLEQVALGLSSATHLLSVFQALQSVHDFVGIDLDNGWGSREPADFFAAASAPGALDRLERASILLPCTDATYVRG